MNKETKSTPNGPQSQEKKKQNRRKPPHWKKRGNNNNRKPNNQNNNNAGGTKNNNSCRRNNKSRHNQFIDVYTSDFQAMHERCVKMGMVLPIKYKVHKPKAYSGLKQKLQQGTLRYVNHHDEKGEAEAEAEDPSSSISQQQPQQKSNNQVYYPDGMIVRPDVKSLPFFFLGNEDTSLSEFVKNPRQTERNLQKQIDASFQPTTTATTGSGGDNVEDGVEDVTRGMTSLSTTTTTTDNVILPTCDPTIMKFACAADLLAEEPNGFACVASSSKETIENVRDWTRKLALTVAQKATDHGDFVVSLPRDLLWEFLQATQADKSRNKGVGAAKNSNKPTPPAASSKIRSLVQVQDDILARMAQQGVETTTTNITKEDDTMAKIKFGHHLESLLYLMMQTPSATNNSNGNKKNKDPTQAGTTNSTTTTAVGENYMLIYGFDDSSSTESQGGVQLELNIPGGKRALGETSVQAAIRETEEETSLKWDEEWITKIYQNKKDPSLKMNRYYMLHPPAASVIADLLQE